ncbi:PEP-CTERM/exosortase system-associated acyltransferase [Halomonas sp. THAF12]|uniref:PEP-CTERM/exosortase system-associated acyltransferase n=1 Tax=Halomonas sp. B23F22_10 TaxID=3459515 RepID=UPI00373F819D
MTSPPPEASPRKLRIEPELYTRFREEFMFRLAGDAETQRRIFRLRYDIYCEELGYEAPADPKHHLEFDAYDERAILCLIEHRKSGLAAGCMRLVLPDTTPDGRSCRLPLQEHGDDSLTHPNLHPARLCLDHVCEISRLAISPLFRKHSTIDEIDSIVRHQQPFSATDRETFPLIVIGLFLATYALLGLSNRPHAFAMMEPRLPRLLRMSGFHFTRVGETIEFHGKRNAFYIDQRRVEEEMSRDLMPLYRHIMETLAPQLEGALPRQAIATSS